MGPESWWRNQPTRAKTPSEAREMRVPSMVATPPAVSVMPGPMPWLPSLLAMTVELPMVRGASVAAILGMCQISVEPMRAILPSEARDIRVPPTLATSPGLRVPPEAKTKAPFLFGAKSSFPNPSGIGKLPALCRSRIVQLLLALCHHLRRQRDLEIQRIQGHPRFWLLAHRM